MFTCSGGKRLQFIIRSDEDLDVVTRESLLPLCENELDWLSEWRQAIRHYAFLCVKHADEQLYIFLGLGLAKSQNLI